jgi:hypothetical protein
MKPPTSSPPPPQPPDDKNERPAERGAVKRPSGHGSYKLGGEPAVGQRWHEAPPPPPAVLTRFDDGVPHRPRPAGEVDLLHNVDIDHEHRDVDLKAVIVSAILLAVVVMVSQGLMWGLFRFFASQAAANDPQLSPLVKPTADLPRNTLGSPFFTPEVGGPQLMVNEPMNLAKHRDEEQKRLHGYGWVNQAGGVAYMPIEEAKKLIRERGLPIREGEPVAPGLGTRAPSRGEASGGRMLMIGGDSATAPSAPAAPAQPEKPVSDAPTAKPHGPGGH